MAKKDFSDINTNPVYATIAAATEVEEKGTTMDSTTKNKDRRTYNEDEAAEYKASLKTAGRKGLKLPRINMAFTPENYDYIKTMATVSGLNLTEFVNKIISQSLEQNKDLYDRAIEFRKNLQL